LWSPGQAEQPQDTDVFAAGDRSSVTHVKDGDASSYWSATQGDGVWVETSNPPYRHLGIVSATPGYSATVYYTTKSKRPKSKGGWTKIRSIGSAKNRQRVWLPKAARSASYYLLVIDSRGPVRINEIQLLFRPVAASPLRRRRHSRSPEQPWPRRSSSAATSRRPRI